MAERRTIFDSSFAARLSATRDAPNHGAIRSEEREGFANAQKLGFQCAKDIAKEIREGWTERKVAKLMDTYLRDHGVKSFFHKSFAWAGDRSRFEGFERSPIAPELTSYAHFLPSRRVIKPGDVVILDCAPTIEGYTGDIGYTTSLGERTELAKAKNALLDLRRELATWFASEMSTQEIWTAADLWIREHGFENRHQLYPFSVLGHRLHRLHLSNLPGLSSPFSVQALYGFATRSLFPDLLGPFHAGDKYGFWAIEPHLGCPGFGAKFEEILVVEPGRATWLADGPS